MREQVRHPAVVDELGVVPELAQERLAALARAVDLDDQARTVPLEQATHPGERCELAAVDVDLDGRRRGEPELVCAPEVDDDAAAAIVDEGCAVDARVVEPSCAVVVGERAGEHMGVEAVAREVSLQCGSRARVRLEGIDGCATARGDQREEADVRADVEEDVAGAELGDESLDGRLGDPEEDRRVAAGELDREACAGTGGDPAASEDALRERQQEPTREWGAADAPETCGESHRLVLRDRRAEGKERARSTFDLT